MESKNTKLFRQWLDQHKLLKNISIIDGDTDNYVIAFISASYVGPKVSANKTSKRQLAHLKRMVARDIGLTVDFRITSDEDIIKIESGISVLVCNVVGNSDTKVFLSVSIDRHADLWFYGLPSFTTEKMKKEIIEIVKDYLKKVGVSLHEVYLYGASVPSSAAILRAIKVLQPATIESVNVYLSGRGFPLMPVRWVKSHLDGLRKKNFIVWTKDTYSMTDLGLASLPIVRGRSSSDVERALALGKRRW